MNSDGDKIGLGRFCATIFSPLRFQCVAYIIVTVAMISSHQGGKKKTTPLKYFFPLSLPQFFSLKQSKVKHRS